MLFSSRAGRDQAAQTESRGSRGASGRANLEGEGPLPTASGETPPGCGAAADPPARQGSLWPQHLAAGSGQLSHTLHFRMPGALVILSSPWWTPGLPHARSALCPRTEAPSCHPPVAQLLLKDVLQRAGLLCFHPRLKNTWLQTQMEGKEGAKASCNQAPTIFGGGPLKSLQTLTAAMKLKDACS